MRLACLPCLRHGETLALATHHPANTLEIEMRHVITFEHADDGQFIESICECGHKWRSAMLLDQHLRLIKFLNRHPNARPDWLDGSWDGTLTTADMKQALEAR